MRLKGDPERLGDRWPALLFCLTVLVLLATACGGNGDALGDDLASTTSVPAQTNSSAPAATSSTAPVPTTTTTPATTTTSSVFAASQVIVTIDEGGLRVEPADVVRGPAEGVELLVVNDTDEPLQIVFLSILAGSPDDLPVVDGNVDVSRCNQIFGDADEEDPSPATFGCFGHLGEATPIEIVQMSPGETLPLDDGVLAGVHVIVDHRSGGYEEGRYAAFEVLEPTPDDEGSPTAWFVEIAGAYEKPPGEVGYLEISLDGVLLWAMDRNDPEQIELDGSLDGDTVVMTDPDCGPDIQGRYEIHPLGGGGIDVVLVEDACPGRAGLIPGRYDPLS